MALVALRFDIEVDVASVEDALGAFFKGNLDITGRAEGWHAKTPTDFGCSRYEPWNLNIIFVSLLTKGCRLRRDVGSPTPLGDLYSRHVTQIFTYFIERAFVKLRPNDFLLKMLREPQPFGNPNLDVDQTISSAHFPVRRDRAQTLVEISELHDVAVENSARQLCARVVH